ncbi:MAG TPA: hypothetical protein VHL14_02000 [Steroidobacteraceae bacterium]|nr:hypothetical protein [Steroidobacteraceae bacterium]
MIRKLWLTGSCFLLISFAAISAHADIELMDTPVKVTATLHTVEEESGLEASIAVHNGPIAQLVNTTVTGMTNGNAATLLRKQISWRDPYLFVHSSCNANSVRRCGGDVVFKVFDNKVIRLGDFVVTENPVYTNGRFYDGYDKLGEHIGFTIVMRDVNDALQVEPALTWSANAAVWKIRSTHITSVHPAREWSDAEWDKYFDAVLNNAALARYCNQSDELQALLDAVNPLLDVDHRRMLTDTLSKVIPLEKPRAWRKAY